MWALRHSIAGFTIWESGRGYPSIDSLKEISKYFSVSIDDLLSGEKLVTIAEKENKANLRSVCDLLFGIVDLMTITLVVLPLYPNLIEGYYYSVNLLAYTQTSLFNRLIYGILCASLMLIGGLKVILNRMKLERGQRIITDVSIFLSIITVLFFAMAREAYAITMAFLLLIIKGILVLKISRMNC